MSISAPLLLLVLVLAAIGLYSWRSASRTARRAEHKSATAVEAAKLAIVTATTHQQPATSNGLRSDQSHLGHYPDTELISRSVMVGQDITSRLDAVPRP